MRLVRGALSAWSLGLWAVFVWAAPEMPAERERIAAERLQAQSLYAAEEEACRHRFAVTNCIDVAQHRQRATLAALRERELALDDAERRERAAARLRAIELKSAASGPPSASLPAAAIETPVVPGRPSLPASTGAPVTPSRRDGRDPAVALEAARRASAAEARRLDAEAERARIAKREAERATRGKAAGPLPIPDAPAGLPPMPAVPAGLLPMPAVPAGSAPAR